MKNVEQLILNVEKYIIYYPFFVLWSTYIIGTNIPFIAHLKAIGCNWITIYWIG